MESLYHNSGLIPEYLPKRNSLNKYNKKGGKLEGTGTYGAVYSFPRLPYIKNEKYDFYGKKITELNFLNNSIQKNEVSKVFFHEEDFDEEKNNYILLFNEINLDENYFNIPLAYGNIDVDFIKKNVEKSIENKTKIYNNKWSGKNNTFKYEIKQITFKKGYDICKSNINTFYFKFKNILNCIKFMEKDNLIFDDLKLENMLDSDDKFKISDFNSINKISKIMKKYNDLYLKNIFYYIYPPIITSLIYYYYNIKTNNSLISLKDVLKKIYKIKSDDVEYLTYSRTLFSKIKEIISLSSFNITINTENINLNNDLKNNSKNIKKIKVNITKSAYDYIQILIDQINIDQYLDKYINYLNLKYDNDVNVILYELLKKINIYSTGICIFSFLEKKFNEINKNNIKLVKHLIEIGILCTITIFNEKNEIYLNLNSIDNIIKNYNKYNNK